MNRISSAPKQRRQENFRRRAFFALLATLSLTGGASSAENASKNPPADLELWRLDCGEMRIDDISYFSDAFAYDGRSAVISNGCYLIRNADRYLLWDAGLPAELLGNKAPDDGWTSSISTTIADQIKQLGIAPADVDFISVSHYHGDHIGQAGDFAASTLVMSEADAAFIRAAQTSNARKRLTQWFDKGAKIVNFKGDHDVFGDQTVTILATPGHTPGHGALLVNLPKTGPVLLTGDLFHFRSEIGRRNVSRWNTSRADTIASIERFEAIVSALEPIVVVQHEPEDITLLPAFPDSAK